MTALEEGASQARVKSEVPSLAVRVVVISDMVKEFLGEDTEFASIFILKHIEHLRIFT